MKKPAQPYPATWGIPTDGRIPALSVRIPWTWALLYLGKRVENRLEWSSCHYRGPLILHGSSWPTGVPDLLCRRPNAGMREMVETSCTMFEMARQSGRDLPDAFTPLEILGHRGGVLGLCNLIDIITGPLEFSAYIASGKLPKHQAAWYMGGFALILEDVRGVPFVPCGGAPGLFGVHPAAYEQLHLQPA